MKHTPETLTTELEAAKRSGSQSEITDLTLLLANAQRPKGAPKLTGSDAAGNRQAQRRYGRGRTYDSNAHNAKGRTPRPGDHVRVPNGEVWLVTSTDGDIVRSDNQPGMPGWRNCALTMCTVVDGPAPSTSPTEPVILGVDRWKESAETLYGAFWDVIERMGASSERDELERALRAYEANAPEA